MKKGMIIALLVVAAIAVTSLVLFSKQGGFGGGHGAFDRVIFILGLPWAAVSWPQFLIKRDFVWLIALPFGLNVLSVFLIGVVIRTVRRKIAEPSHVR